MQKTVILGVIGVDAHVVGNKIIAQALRDAAFNVVNLGTFVGPEDFIKAAIETNADAIMIGSLCGHGELDCQGFREKCVEAGRAENRCEWKTMRFAFCSIMPRDSRLQSLQ